jgi:rsbT co-antagonist protein RsbR
MRSITERQARLWCLAIGAFGALASGLAQLPAGNMLGAAISVGASVLLGALSWLYARGWEPARLVAVGFATLVVVSSVGLDSVLIGVASVAAFALLLAETWWVVGVSLLTFAGILGRELAGGRGLERLSLTEFPTLVILVGLMAVTRLVLEAERRRSQVLTAAAQAAQAASAAQAAELARQAEALTRQNEQQRRLLTLVEVLEVPAVTIAEGVVLAPISGHIDGARAASLTGRLLATVGEQRLRLVLLDLSGVPEVDSEVAQALQRLIQAIQLLGCQVNISGISAPVAGTMAQLGLTLHGVKTWRSPQEALAALS